MDYEKKYKDALERAKKEAIDGFLDAVAIDTIFPELKESEDEKTRKSLISFLEELGTFGKDTNFDKWGKSDCAAWICWLEKQGEHDEYPRDVIENAISFLTYRNNGMPESEAKDIVNAIITVLNPKYWPQHIRRQKPAWSEVDECTLLNTIRLLCSCGKCSTDRKLWLLSLKDRIQPQNTWKPSDEQMQVLHWCMPLLIEPKPKAVLESLINDLKKLREE